MAGASIWLTSALLLLVSTNTGSAVIVEKGSKASIQCTFPNPMTDVTWQVINGYTTVSLSRCTQTGCTNYVPSLYQGFNSILGSGTAFGLNVTTARTNETDFVCVARSGERSNVYLEVYSWPRVNILDSMVYDTYVEYICTVYNVYPNATASLVRSNDHGQENMTADKCVRGQYGAGSVGDYRVICTWQISMINMKWSSYAFCNASAVVSNMSGINKLPLQSERHMAVIEPTKVVQDITECPIGPGVYEDSVLIGTTAVCICRVKTAGIPAGIAHWLTKDGNVTGEQIQGGNATMLTYSYNYSDPEQSYTCRGENMLKAYYYSKLPFKPKFTTGYVIAEKGQPKTIECLFPTDVTNITWQTLGITIVNVSACSFVNNQCKDQSSSSYQAFIPTTGRNRSAGLRIAKVSRSATQFLCLADNGLKTNMTQLEVYATPKKPTCRQNVDGNYMTYNCTTQNVYPRVNAVLHRRGIDLKKYEPDVQPLRCLNDPFKRGSEGDNLYSCVWKVPIDTTNDAMVVYVEMAAHVSNESAINNTVVVSDDIVTNLTVPEVMVNKEKCPVGPGVQNDSIEIGTVATCKCEIKSAGIPPGFARWLTENKTIIGHENSADGSSMLNIVYNSSDSYHVRNSDPNETFQCWPHTSVKGDLDYLIYQPSFYSSAPLNDTTGLTALVLALVAVCSGIVVGCARM